ncbi:hypothetical protein BFD03_08715 [Limosilactobacillus reuteri]|jgi:hypothetical protein|uniref:Toxin n=1 Tax=Limosilactobacillus reuteri TaxID=1598 RepID=A0A1C2G664_LIMRT|nr:hypothetical protein [Limosilactobacillus reuteri]PEG78528.1 toxin [Lactobacillus sp. UMNPBX18]OCX46890.1 hypothetical protein BFD03_08715 [Limosilactobacillus reuteri]OTA51543.1 hypothetical protein BHL85_03470 [Limosilactobacillus reuteri]OTA83695.1 hypothetical protein BHL83_07920 [Limosilactobacillus reuteri]WPC93354.1 toxin [Limosilactobacillus reuteri]
MYAYEELASEYPHLTINYPQNMPNNLAGLNIDTDVYLNRANSDIKMYEILQEEIAHYDTTAGDIVTKDTPDGRKQEHKARSLAMMRAVSLDKLIYCYQHDIWNLEDIADYCNVDVEYLMDAIDNYRVKRGLIFAYKGYRFDLRKNVKIEKM